MFIVVAGASRSGKTTLSKKLRELDFIHYKMDSIKRGVCKVTNTKTYYFDDYSKEVTTIIKQVMLDEKEDNIIFDTPHISPKDAVELKRDDTAIVFLGYDTMKLEKFIENTRKYDKNTWSSSLPLNELEELFILSKDFSIENKKLCDKLDIRYYDITQNRNEALARAYEDIVNILNIPTKLIKVRFDENEKNN